MKQDYCNDCAHEHGMLIRLPYYQHFELCDFCHCYAKCSTFEASSTELDLAKHWGSELLARYKKLEALLLLTEAARWELEHGWLPPKKHISEKHCRVNHRLYAFPKCRDYRGCIDCDVWFD